MVFATGSPPTRTCVLVSMSLLGLVLRSRQIDRQQLGLVGRRANDVAKQHARRALFLHKHGLAQHLGRQVHPVHGVADVAVAVCRLGLDQARGLTVEGFARDQIPIRHFLTSDGADQAVVHAQGVEGLLECFIARR